MAIVVGIDGSGSETLPGKERDTRYDEYFKNSFVSRICKGSGNKHYIRGPVKFGGGILEAVFEGESFIRSRRKDREPILLTGFSRGAAGVVALARRLKRDNIRVNAMMLFDCVDRAGDIDAEFIPSNVGTVMHVVRDPRGSSRESFDNDGLKTEPRVSYEGPFPFMCTHGAMGGTPWKPDKDKGQKMTDFINEGFPDFKTKITFQKDAEVSEQVWQFCLPFLARHGFN